MLYSEKELNNSKSSRYGWKEERKKAAAFFWHTNVLCIFISYTYRRVLLPFFIVQTMKMFSTRLYFFYVRSYTFYKLNNKKKGTAESLYTFMLIYMYGTVRHEEEYKAHSLYAVHCYAM